MKNSEMEAVSELVRLLGGKTWEIHHRRCTGKWHGTIDYGIVIDNDHYISVSNGMSYFEEMIRRWIKAIKSFTSNKEAYLQIIREQLERDNDLARKEGMKGASIVDIGIVSPEAKGWGNFFYPYIVLDVDGFRFKHTETGFAYAVMEGKLDEKIEESRKRGCFTAGAVEYPDYILFNVRFSSKEELYKIW